MKHYPKLLVLFLFITSYSLLNAQSNDSLSLSLIYPSEVPAAQETVLILTGAGFNARMNVNLSNVGSIPKTLIDANTMTIRIPANLTAGTYLVTVVRRNGSASNPLTLLVLASPSTTPEPTQTGLPAPIVISAEPRRIQSGTAATISILGSGFTRDLVVRLQGYGLLSTTFVNSGALSAELPSAVPARETYPIELISGNGTFYPTSASLRVVAPVEPSPIPQPTEMPIPTEAAPEPIMAPLLQLSSFTVNPEAIDAGQTVTVNFTITNRGNEMAQMITVNLSSSDSFVPATGQVAVTISDLAPRASANGQIRLTSSLGIPAGPTIVPLVIEYQNPMGETYSTTAELSLMVNSAPSNSQLVINAYLIEPSPSEAGEAVRLQLTLFNLGEGAISQVLLRIGSDGSILIPQDRGDTIPIGDIAGRQTAPVELSMLVNSSAEAGYQMQPISISYYQNGETYEVSSSIMVHVVANTPSQPLLLLASYENSVANLQPGSRFNITIEIENAGTAPAQNTLITFGIVQAEDNSGAGANDNVSSSVAFAPLGSAGLDFVGDIASAAMITSSQEFMVGGSLESGIYPLPITLQYTLPDGTNNVETLNISLVVTAPPQLQFNPQQLFPEAVYVGDSVPINIEIINSGNDVNLQEAVFTVDNGELIDGANIDLNPLEEGEETSIEALLIPLQEGDLNLTLRLHYTDELNQAQSILLNYSTLVIAAPPFEEISLEDAISYEEEFITEQSDPNWFGRFMMAFFGLGS